MMTKRTGICGFAPKPNNETAMIAIIRIKIIQASKNVGFKAESE